MPRFAKRNKAGEFGKPLRGLEFVQAHPDQGFRKLNPWLAKGNASRRPSVSGRIRRCLHRQCQEFETLGPDARLFPFKSVGRYNSPSAGLFGRLRAGSLGTLGMFYGSVSFGRDASGKVQSFVDYESNNAGGVAFA